MKNTFRLMALMMIFIAGCAYPSDYGLEGKSVKYHAGIPGNYKINETTLSISRIDDYNVQVKYFKPDDIEDQEMNGVGRFVENKGDLYAVVKDKNRYFVAKILDASDKILEINILDENDMGANTKFKSTKQFTSFVFKDKNIFSKKYDQKFRRL